MSLHNNSSEYLEHLKKMAGQQYVDKSNHKHILFTPQSAIDHFPYRKFHRGRHELDTPIIFNRTAGYSPRLDHLYKSPLATEQTSKYLHLSKDIKHSYPHADNLFQTSCLQVYPSFHSKSNPSHNTHVPINSIYNR